MSPHCLSLQKLWSSIKTRNTRIQQKLNPCIILLPVNPDDRPVSIIITLYHIVSGFASIWSIFIQYRLYTPVTIANNVTSIPPVFSYRKMVYSSAYIIVGIHSLPKKSAFHLLCSRRLCSASCCIFCSSIPDTPICGCEVCGVFCENCWGFMPPILLLSIATSLLSM